MYELRLNEARRDVGVGDFASLQLLDPRQKLALLPCLGANVHMVVRADARHHLPLCSIAHVMKHMKIL